VPNFRKFGANLAPFLPFERPMLKQMSHSFGPKYEDITAD